MDDVSYCVPIAPLVMHSRALMDNWTSEFGCRSTCLLDCSISSFQLMFIKEKQLTYCWPCSDMTTRTVSGLHSWQQVVFPFRANLFSTTNAVIIIASINVPTLICEVVRMITADSRSATYSFATLNGGSERPNELSTCYIWRTYCMLAYRIRMLKHCECKHW